MRHRAGAAEAPAGQGLCRSRRRACRAPGDGAASDRVFLSLAKLNAALAAKVAAINARPFQKRDGSRESEYLGQEKGSLIPLPTHPYRMVVHKRAPARRGTTHRQIAEHHTEKNVISSLLSGIKPDQFSQEAWLIIVSAFAELFPSPLGD